MKIKKVICAALAAVMMVSAAPAVFAVDMDIIYKAGGYSKSDIELMEIIERSIRERDNSYIDISKYNVSYDEFESLYGSVMFNNPEYYYVSMTSAYLIYDSEDHMLKYAPYFTHSKSRTERMGREIEEKADEILSGINDNMTDVEKVLYIHDAVITSCDYYEGTNTSTGRTIYDVLVRGSSVCVGYSLTFQYFMDKLGIPCICITNNDHIWNMVNVNNNWYHVDTTWDDMNSESPNFVMHDMVMLSEYGLDTKDVKHERWDYGMTADSSKYDDFFWKDTFSAMTYYNGYWYYNKVDGLYRYNFKTGKNERCAEISDRWKYRSSKWRISFGKTALYNNAIIFSTPYEICRYEPSSGNVTTISRPAMEPGYQIYDFKINGSELRLFTSDDYTQMSKSVKKVSLGKQTTTESIKKVSSNDRTGLQISKTAKEIKLSWDDDKNAEQYYVYRYNIKTKKVTLVTQTIDNKVSVKRSSNDENYKYAIKIRTADGLSGYSQWISA